MAVKIRLARLGRKNRAYWRIVVMDERKKRDGKSVDILGYYQPLESSKFKINEERAIYWLTNGAIPSDTVRSLFKKQGLMKKFHDMKLEKKKELKGTDAAPEAPAPDQPETTS